MIKITETPRDGMQGLIHFIPTKNKIKYINALLQCGFDTLETGSFVSPRAIPQMADTGEVLNNLKDKPATTKIAVLVANEKGGTLAKEYDIVDKIFYPFSVSPTFLKKNLNTTLEKGENTIDFLQNLCVECNKELVVYLSLAFGNPYSDAWSIDLVSEWIQKLMQKGIYHIKLAETIGDVDAEVIQKVCAAIIPEFPRVEFGFHTHSIPGKGTQKVNAAFTAGIRHFDTVLGGLGGCPMTGHEMVPNLDLTELLDFCHTKGLNCNVNEGKLVLAKQKMAGIIFKQ
ncbi:MAG: hydroxymethylglutaryl-CoA lyase [Bacteroidales bacterium]|nr:hydroxymethylglutaryl-CoA lyase [Bacteroidales bacterium]